MNVTGEGLRQLSSTEMDEKRCDTCLSDVFMSTRRPATISALTHIHLSFHCLKRYFIVKLCCFSLAYSDKELWREKATLGYRNEITDTLTAE